MFFFLKKKREREREHIKYNVYFIIHLYLNATKNSFIFKLNTLTAVQFYA